MKHTFRFLASRSDNGGWAIAPEENIQIEKVLRLVPGDKIELFDGLGWEAEAALALVSKSGCEINLHKERYTPIVESVKAVAVGALKKGSFEDILPSLVEIGITEIHIFLQEGSDSFRLHQTQQGRLRKIVIEAAKVAKCAYIPRLFFYSSIHEFTGAVSFFGGMKLVADPDADVSLVGKELPNSVLVAIGGEMGFSCHELTQLVDAGFLPVSMGSNILKAKTAIMVATTILVSRLDWG